MIEDNGWAWTKCVHGTRVYRSVELNKRLCEKCEALAESMGLDSQLYYVFTGKPDVIDVAEVRAAVAAYGDPVYRLKRKKEQPRKYVKI